MISALLLLCTVSLRADAVDSYLQARMRETRIPGLAVAVVHEGRVVKARGYGLANIELDVPVTPKTVFEIGSITKQFTSAAVMLLVEEGKIDLDAPISKYLAGVPAAWQPITVRHLLHHSAGIEEYLAVRDFPDVHHTGASHDEITRLIFERLRLEFPAGETWSYSNPGYLLLGNIVEKVSGVSYWDFLATRIFTPLGMTSTRSSDPEAIIPKRAAGYAWRDGAYENRRPLAANAYAAGSIVSTVEDLVKWDGALRSGRVLSGKSWSQVWTPLRLRGGIVAPFNYGFGWTVDPYHGRRVIAHTGGTPGFSSALYRFVDDGLTVVLLTNHADKVIDHLAIDIAGMFVPALARPARDAVDPDPETSRRLEHALRGAIAGEADPPAFTPEMSMFLTTAGGKGVWQWAGSDGPIRSFTFSEAERSGDYRIVRYRATLGASTRWFSFTLDRNGRIAQMNWW